MRSFGTESGGPLAQPLIVRAAELERYGYRWHY